MIRPIEARDLPRLKELEVGYEWKFGPDFAVGMVYVDANDIPVMFAGTWVIAEAHMVCDPRWGTPAVRMEALRMVHQEINDQLKARGISRVTTWMDGMRSFTRRLKSLGWFKSEGENWQTFVR